MKEKIHEFTGKHLMVNYMNCDKQALNNFKELENVMKKACMASKATVLNAIKHLFPVKNSDIIGMSMVLILSESHASIHTYPEYDSCFVDFFTCGTECLPEEFDRTMREYLKPQIVKPKLFFRDNDVIKEHFLLPHQKKSSKNFLKEIVKNFVKK
ncbi:MAG: S-adenosylmethionine decarboxylase proenzyme [Candidatus Anoxychlamydiales bacterium]|nr:S-adenosylmethionine decarboxylase proenzyme [Candidatus Anoxychlamydiales bacterium]